MARVDTVVVPKPEFDALVAENARLREENERLQRSADAWQEDARLRETNAEDLRAELTRLRDENEKLRDYQTEKYDEVVDQRDTLLAALGEMEARFREYARNSGNAAVDAALEGSVLKDRMAGENRAWHVAAGEARAAISEVEQGDRPRQWGYGRKPSEVEGEK